MAGPVERPTDALNEDNLASFSSRVPSSYFSRHVATKSRLARVPCLGSEGTETGISSQGPTADGRLKPDLCAPGEMIVRTPCRSPARIRAVRPALSRQVSALSDGDPNSGQCGLEDLVQQQARVH